MALVALASAGITAGGVVAVGQFATADRPTGGDVVAAQPVSTEAIGTVPPATAPTPEPGDGGEPVVTGDGTITVQVGDGEPITVDLGDLGVFGGTDDFGPIGECLGQLFDFEFDVDVEPNGDVRVGDLPPLSIPPFGDVFGGGHVAVIDDGGMTVADFGDGDGSITITKQGDTITVTSEGDVTVQDLDDLMGEMPMLDESWFDQNWSDVSGDVPFPDFELIQECLDNA
jgi:hypothetical protein